MSFFDEDKTLKEDNRETIEKAFDEKEIEEFLFNDDGYKSKVCALLYGKDGTGKSGIVLDAAKQLKDDEKMVIIDLDGGCEPIALTHHSDEYKNRKIIIKNPIVATVTDKDVEIDYQQTMNNIKKVLYYLKNNIEKHKVRIIVLDGLSTLLKYCEYQTRSDKHIAADGGMQLRYWINRMRFFLTIMEVAKSLPCDRYFIAHEDFIINTGEEKSSVVIKTNQMMFQKIKCTTETAMDGKVFKAIIDKNKANTASEGQEFKFLSVKDKKYKWDTKEIFEVLK